MPVNFRGPVIQDVTASWSVVGAYRYVHQPFPPIDGSHGRDVRWLRSSTRSHRAYFDANSSTVSSSTLAPLVQSCQCVSSLGEWLMPATLGTKIMPSVAGISHSPK